MWDTFLKLMRFGPYARHLIDPASLPPPRCAVSAWAVAHGAGLEFVGSVSELDDCPGAANGRWSNPIEYI